jgi:ABC-type uncharacterized transport system substrate-binding protein
MRAWLAALGCLAAATPAMAHPHLWIEAQATFAFERGVITGLALRWRFDETFSDFVLGEYDGDGDGAFDAEETRLVAEEAFTSLAELGWLTHLRVDGAAVPLPDYRDLQVTSEDGIVTYHFVLPLPQPVDPRQRQVRVGLFDESYFIDVVFDGEEPVVLAGEAPPGCTHEVFEDTDNPIYYGMVAPYATELVCAAS